MKRRMTRQRQMILDVILGHGNHMHAEDVLTKLPENSGIGLATVYRNLNVLCEEGTIQKISGNHFSFYDGNPEPHDHLYCIRCKKVMDVDMLYDKRMDRDVSDFLHADVYSHSVTYEGLCPNCLQEEELNNGTQRIKN